MLEIGLGTATLLHEQEVLWRNLTRDMSQKVFLMRLLWVRRCSSGEGAGDSLYDDKLIRALVSAGHDIVQYGLGRNKKATQFARAALRLSLPEQHGVGGPEDVARVRGLLEGGGFDAAVVSHEHLDAFASAVRSASKLPFIAIRQNVTSDAMSSILRRAGPLPLVYRELAERQERFALRGGLYAAITAISVRDRRLLETLSGRGDVALVLPGAPPASPLNANAEPIRELVLSGTFDWFPKARDLRQFVADFAAAPPTNLRLRVATSVPDAQRAALGATEDDVIDAAGAIRFGVITDRFTAGHKLKTAAYLMNNCAVISFARVIEDFADLPHAKNWIVEVDSMAQVNAAIDNITARPANELRRELAVLKASIADRFDWSKQAQSLASVISAAVRERPATA